MMTRGMIDMGVLISDMIDIDVFEYGRVRWVISGIWWMVSKV